MAKRATRVNADDRVVFAQLYRSLHRFASVVRPSEIEADDLLQEALVQSLRRQPLGELDNPGAYLRRTIINLASNHRRRSAIGKAALRMEAHSASPGVYDSYPSDLSDLLALTPVERAILYLVHVERYSFGEVAVVVGCSEVAARQKAARARKKVRVSLEAPS